jgi:release factor glutamine methyltransferase
MRIHTQPEPHAVGGQATISGFGYEHGPVTTREVLKRMQALLTPIAGELAAREAESIVQHTLSTSYSDLHLHPRRIIQPDEHLQIKTYIQQRLTGMPLPYVLKCAYFYDQEFHVSSEVLIPRPDTEILVETVLCSETGASCVCLDFGTGSGIIARILSKNRNLWKIIAIDVSLKACYIASKNCPNLIPGIVCMNGCTALKSGPLFDCIVSNPPYISEQEHDALEDSVARWEPRTALHGGIDGLNFYRSFAQGAGNYLKPGGRLYCEIGWQQADALRNLFKQPLWLAPEFFPDLAGRLRVLKTVYQPTIPASGSANH